MVPLNSPYPKWLGRPPGTGGRVLGVDTPTFACMFDAADAEEPPERPLPPAIYTKAITAAAIRGTRPLERSFIAPFLLSATGDPEQSNVLSTRHSMSISRQPTKSGVRITQVCSKGQGKMVVLWYRCASRL